MGNESDKLVFDYLSRIGDLAHSTSMTAAERARLVGGLRSEIDRMRAEKGGAESKSSVKKILDRLGRPEDVVAGGASGAGGAGVPGQGVHAPAAAAPGGGDSAAVDDGGTGISLRKKISLRKSARPSPPAPADGPNPPHLARPDELGPEESDPDWWRVDAGPRGGGGPFGGGGGGSAFGDSMPGFTGGIVVPEMLKPPPVEEKDGEKKGEELKKEAPPAGNVARLRKLIQVPGAVAKEAKEKPKSEEQKPSSVPRVGGVVEWSAVALLVAGSLLGQLLALGAGWLAAWWSPRLRRNEAKWAAAGMPGLVAGGTLVWLWGRTTGKWGEPLAEGGKAMGDALTEAGPVVLRVAAIASALCLVVLARRPRG